MKKEYTVTMHRETGELVAEARTEDKDSAATMALLLTEEYPEHKVTVTTLEKEE